MSTHDNETSIAINNYVELTYAIITGPVAYYFKRSKAIMLGIKEVSFQE